MKSVVRPELPTASVGSSQAPTAAVDNSALFATSPQSTYKSGKVVQTSGATSIYVVPDHLAHADPLVERFEHWCRANLSLGFDLSAAASSVHASERTLSRRIKDVTGKAPLGFFQDIRVQRAVHLLETTADDIEKIAAAVGYADGVSLRALLRDKLGKGTREIRARVRNKGGEHHDR